MSGSSPIDTLPGSFAFHVGSPLVYGLWAQTSKWVFIEHFLRCGGCCEAQSRSLMNSIGGTTWMSFESCPNGPKVPATTELPEATALTATAKALTIIR